jgi:DNA polymerase elongation subunit (family B)
MLTFNLSPETVTLAGTAKFTPDRKNDEEGGPPTWTRVGDTLHFRFPDNRYRKDILVDVDLSKKGFAAELIEQLFVERSNIKKQMANAANKTEKSKLDSQQQAIKVLLNSIYGYCGQQKSHYGNLPVAIAIVQLSKWMIKKVVKWLGDRVVEIDTDGIILQDYKENEADEATVFLNSKIHDQFRVDSKMLLEPENFVCGYFHKAKNYVLVEIDKKTGKEVVVKHGTAFKSSRLSTIYKSTLDKVLVPVLKGEDDLFELYKELTDLDHYTMDDYKMRIRLSKDPASYANPNAIYPRLAKQYTKHTGREAEIGDVLEFVVIKNGNDKDYKLFDQAKIEEIDKNYYLAEIDKVFELFRVNTKEIGQLTLFK